LLRGVVLVDHALDATLRIASRSLEILVRVGELVFDQFLVALGEIELLVERFLLAFRRALDLFRQSRDFPGDFGLFLFALGNPIERVFDSRRRRNFLRGGLIQRGGEREIHFVIGLAKSLARQILLFGSGGQL
jgi:hypothetical protein